MRFEDIVEFPHSSYAVDVSWRYLEISLADYAKTGLNLDPDFQRGYVWTEAQQVAFVEHVLRGGKSPRNIYFNCPTWYQQIGELTIIDGKQRLQAARLFLGDHLRVFGGYTCSDLGGKPPIDVAFRFHVHTMATRRDILEWYLGINNGGSIHTQDEIARVRALLEAEIAKG